jgi:intein/homing endonuclease
LNELAYIKGVMDGDGYIDRHQTVPSLVLDVTSKPFADRFAEALGSQGLNIRRTEHNRTNTFNGYTFTSHFYRVRAKCSEDFIANMNSPATFEGNLAWLIGFFQAEGCRRVQKYPDRECHIWHITNKDKEKLSKVQSILQRLGIKSAIYTKKDGISMLCVQRRTDIEKLEALGFKK